jgi:hypothetical protein
MSLRSRFLVGGKTNYGHKTTDWIEFYMLNYTALRRNVRDWPLEKNHLHPTFIELGKFVLGQVHTYHFATVLMLEWFVAEQRAATGKQGFRILQKQFRVARGIGKVVTILGVFLKEKCLCHNGCGAQMGAGLKETWNHFWCISRVARRSSTCALGSTMPRMFKDPIILALRWKDRNKIQVHARL